MTAQTREEIIESAGIEVADYLESLESEVQELREYLHVVRIAQTRGFVLAQDPTKPPKFYCGRTSVQNEHRSQDQG